MHIDDIKNITSHASVMAEKAAANIGLLDTMLWYIKVNYNDDPLKKDVLKANGYIENIREQLNKALVDVDLISEEMKRYNYTIYGSKQADV